jgi:hypothetical protein
MSGEWQWQMTGSRRVLQLLPGPWPDVLLLFAAADGAFFSWGHKEGRGFSEELAIRRVPECGLHVHLGVSFFHSSE